MNNPSPILRAAQINSFVVVGSYCLTWHTSWSRSERGYEILLSILNDFGSRMSFIGLLLFASPIICHMICIVITNMEHNKRTPLILASIPAAIWTVYASFVLINNWGYFNIIKSLIPVQHAGGIFMLAGLVVGLVCFIVYYMEGKGVSHSTGLF